MLLRRTLPVLVTWTFLQVNSSPTEQEHVLVVAEVPAWAQSWQDIESKGKMMDSGCCMHDKMAMKTLTNYCQLSAWTQLAPYHS
jgi:hypothetical protein